MDENQFRQLKRNNQLLQKDLDIMIKRYKKLEKKYKDITEENDRLKKLQSESTCRYWETYRGLSKPRCNQGRGCAKCWEIYNRRRGK